MDKSKKHVDRLVAETISLKSKIIELEAIVRELSGILDETKAIEHAQERVVAATSVVYGNYEPLTLLNVSVAADNLSLEVHMAGVEGYVKYLTEGVFNGKILCVDVRTKTFIYKGENGEVITDVGFVRIMSFLCQSLSDRMFDLCQQHYDFMASTYTKAELNSVDTDSVALNVMRYVGNPTGTSGFVTDVIRCLAKSSPMK
jgi:hypothetical protein